ncbi:epoxide hydrolase [Pseudoduganella sp. FT25W]|uniref:Epoxide hydrolase n=1 Tax=Duganella alba TaxID=2666081 RepID=A0A6L5QD14_9BURK|nr:epoxide hydrolase family protein [Duganella alba]MRX07172.1 epoxide hydrolase [Duganella alba]MRX15133.1 epoxide hydrolase [Duganella alba]
MSVASTQSSDAAAIVPFVIDIPQAELDELRQRLDHTRWPEQETVADLSQGAQLARVKKLVDYWSSEYDWRQVEARLNNYPQFKTEIDGLGIHFMHIRSPHQNALPMVMTHGWPGSIVEFLDVIDPLVDPTQYGGTADQAFHVVIPSIPGFGFSDKPDAKGWNRNRIGKAWDTLMKRLGYQRYVAQGGDWGSVVTTEMGRIQLDGLAAIHVNLPFVAQLPFPDNPTAEEQIAIDQCVLFAEDGSFYHHLQTTRPQTIGYALADSPVGQAAWIYEKLGAWSDNQDGPEQVFSYDQMLNNIMFYWLTNSGASSARMYAEHPGLNFGAVPVDIPVAVSVFPREIYTPPRSWAERTYSQMIYWNRPEKGGHFAAFEQPATFVSELRAAFASIR